MEKVRRSLALMLLIGGFVFVGSNARAFYSTTLDACMPTFYSDCSFLNSPAAGIGSACAILQDGPAPCENYTDSPGYQCVAYKAVARQTDTSWPPGYYADFRCYDAHIYGPSDNAGAVALNYQPRSCKDLRGSIVEVDNMAVAEKVKIVGTPFSLVYQSQRVPGYTANLSFAFSSGSSDPDTTGVSATVSLAGQSFNYPFPPSGGSPVLFTWNGLDASSNPVASAQVSTMIQETNSVGKHDWAGGASGPGNAVLRNNLFTSTTKYSLGLWTVDAVHFLEISTNYLQFGAGYEKAVTWDYDSSTSTYSVPSDDGSEVYVFNSVGQHIATNSALTGATLLTMVYSGALLQTITDSYGNVTTFAYDLSHNPISVTSPYGQVTSLATNSSGYLSSIGVPGFASANLMTYKSGTGLLATFTKPSGEVSTMTYDSVGKLLSDTSSAGPSLTLTQTLDLTQNKIIVGTAVGRSTEVDIQAVGNEPFFNRQEISPAGVTSSDSYPQLYSKTKLLPGYQDYLSYADDGRFGSKVQILSGRSTTIGGSTRSESVAQTVGGSPTTPYNFTTLTETRTVNSGPASTSVYDSSTTTYTNTSSAGRVSTLKINSYEQPTQTKFATFNAVNYAYDTHGRPYTVSQGSRTTTLAYNTAGFISSITDPMSQVTSMTYDANGRVLTTTLPDTRVVTYTYDAGGNIASITPPSSSAHNFLNNLMDFPTTYQAPSLGSGTLDTLYAYNNDRQLTQVTRPSGSVIAMGYDATTALLTSITSGAASYAFTYPTNDDKLQTATSPDGVISTHYYSGTFPYSVEYTGSGKGLVTYTFDNFFNLSAFQIGTGTTYTLLYDNDQLLKKTGSETINRSSTTGLISDTSVGNAKEYYTYDSTYGELASYQAKYTTTNKFLEAYTRDANGRIATRTVTIGTGSPDIYAYTYDAAGRLTGVTKNSTSIGSYTYDSNSNRTSTTNSGGTFSATYDAEDRLSTYGTKTFSYNLNGERTSQVDSSTSPTTTSYTWDAFGNLKQVTLPSSTQIKYQYDGMNRKVTKTTGTTVNERYVYLDQTRLLGVLNSSGSTVMTFFYGTRNTPEYMIKSGTTYKLFVDHVGSVRQVVNTSTGAVSQELTYDEFGRVLSDSSPGFQPFGFAGGLYDSATGLVQFGARWYDSQVGSWISKDPSLFAGGPNLYGYSFNDPVNFVDRNGKNPFAVIALGLAVYEAAYDATTFLTEAFGNHKSFSEAAKITVDRSPIITNFTDQIIENATGKFSPILTLPLNPTFLDTYLKLKNSEKQKEKSCADAS